MDNNMVIGDSSTHIKDCSLDLLSLQIRFFGGMISDDLDNGVSHVMVDKRFVVIIMRYKTNKVLI